MITAENLPNGGIAASLSRDVQSKLSCSTKMPDNNTLDSTVAEPEFIQHRIKMYNEIKAKYDAWVACQPQIPIQITLLDGRDMPGTAWKTTPFDIAKLLGTIPLDSIVIAKVNGILYDLSRPLEKNCTLEFLDFDNPEGQAVFWHSSAHVLGESCEKHFGCLICFGPPTDEGFFYDLLNPGQKTVLPSDFPSIESHASKIIKEKQKFERLEMTKEQLLEMFAYNPYKLHYIREKIPDGERSTVYRCGPLIDLCLGPHIPNTGKIKAFKVTKSSSSYFLGDAANDSLQRVYGVSFPSKDQMAEYIRFKEEAEKRDHRKIGRDDSLFFFHELSPGSCFYLPHGARIYNTLMEFIRGEYRKRGFQEVITPNLFNTQLWEVSGHLANYKDNMFLCDVEKEQFALKPMNCPGHCLIFGHKERSYRELPIRFADFGVLHRNELSGALTGLTRVRRFQQDDAHIFCRQDQIESEIFGCLDFLDYVYSVLGLSYSLKLATRPENYLGQIETWDRAEESLKKALNTLGKKWELNPGDGAFYGPKIDVYIMDAHRRRVQCATIQLDFQLPERFKLTYRGSGASPDETTQCASDMERPVIIHRAVLGSLERMMAILTEHFSGNWPFWLSPRQVIIVPVSHASDSYAELVYKRLFDAGFHVEVDISDLTFPKKIRNAEIAHHNIILVVGTQEEASQSVNARKASPQGKDVVLSLENVIKTLRELRESKSLQCFLE